MRSMFILMALMALVFVLAEAKQSRAAAKLMAKRSKKSGSTSSGGSFTGTATFFNPSTEGGSDGACGKSESDNAQIVALNAVQYGSTSSKSSWCGKTVQITYKGKTTNATINDACPECSYGDLDLTHTVFKDLESDMSVGEIKVQWKVVN